MKITRIDKLGRIVIPMAFRKQLGIKENDEIKIFIEGIQIILTPNTHRCKICSSKIMSTGKIQICDKCIELIKKL